MLLWHVPDFSAALLATWSIQQIQLLTATLITLPSKQATCIVVNSLAGHINNLAHAQIVHLFVSLLGLPNWLSMLGCYWVLMLISLVPSVHGWTGRMLVSAICACTKFPRNLGNHVILVFFRIWNTHNHVYFSILLWNGHLQWQRWRVLISLGLTHNLHRQRIQWLEAMDKWPCGDCFTFYSMVLRDDVLIENNKYGYITNRAMTIVNFMHALTAETRCSFHPFVNAGYEDIMLICLQYIVSGVLHVWWTCGNACMLSVL